MHILSIYQGTEFVVNTDPMLITGREQPSNLLLHLMHCPSFLWYHFQQFHYYEPNSLWLISIYTTHIWKDISKRQTVENKFKLGMMVHAYNISTQKTETEGLLEDWGQPEMLNEFKASLNYMKTQSQHPSK